MRTILLALALGLLLVGSGTGAQLRYIDDEQITVADSSIGFTAAKINEGSGHPQATLAVCRLETAEIRYRVNGSAPTSSVGTLLYVGDTITLSGHQMLSLFRAIRTGSTSGQLDCTYYAQ